MNVPIVDIQNVVDMAKRQKGWDGKDKWEFHLFKMWVIIDNHSKNCTCYFCEDESYSDGKVYHKKMHYGLNIPPAWYSKTAWWTVKYAHQSYMRVTFSLPHHMLQKFLWCVQIYSIRYCLFNLICLF